MPHVVIKYAHVLICISVGEGSRHFSAFHFKMFLYNISLMPWQLDEFEDHCYSFSSKNIIVKIRNLYDNGTNYGAVITLVTACIIIKMP